MTRIVIASLLNEALTAAFARRLSDADVFSPAALTFLPPEAHVVVAAPLLDGGAWPASSPPGWPFAVRWVHAISVGLDPYPQWLFDVPIVTSARGTSAIALAEFALAAMFAAAKSIPDIWVRAHDAWIPRPIGMLHGRTLGLVGFGATGERLAQSAVALGMNVLALRRSPTPIQTPGVTQTDDVCALFARSDHVVLAAPATPQTRGMINRAVLAHAKPGLHLVNVARGSLIDDDALLWALDEGRVERASLDVTDPEPLPAHHRYYTHPRVRLSPHTSVHTPDTLESLLGKFAANLERFRVGAPLEGIVDRARGY